MRRLRFGAVGETVDILDSKGPPRNNQVILAGAASRLAALLLPQIRPVFSVVAPGDPGAAPPKTICLFRGGP